jgi:Protein of unknown function (DUF1176)
MKTLAAMGVLLVAWVAPAGAVVAQAPPAVPVERSFRDWSVTCDNTRACVAHSASGQDQSEGRLRPPNVGADAYAGWVALRWEPGARARPFVRMGFPVGIGTLPEGATEISVVTASGEQVHATPFTAAPQGEDGMAVPDVLINPFLYAGRSGDWLLMGPKLGHQAYASLSGFVASMRFIESVQGRTGTMSAVIDTGLAHSAVLPTPPQPPTVNAYAFRRLAGARVPRSVRAARSSGCEPAVPDLEDAEIFSAFDMGGGRSLWAVKCDLSSYNVRSLLYMVARPGAALVWFDLPLPTGLGEEPVVINFSAEPETGLVKTHHLDRGLGDCGSQRTWAWTRRSFVLATERAMGSCVGMMPGDWPFTWRTRLIVPVPPLPKTPAPSSP